VALCAAACAIAWAPADAGAAVRAGAVDDPVDQPGEADVASMALRYDDAGALVLRIRFHEPVREADPAIVDWIVTGEAGPRSCADTRQGLAGLLELRSGDVTLTYTESPDEGIPVDTEVPARQRLSDDRRELTLTAESAALAGRPFACSQAWLSTNDDVPPLVLVDVPPASPGAGAPPPPGGEQGGGAPPPAAGGLRVSGARLSVARRGPRITAALRALVCAPVGTRLVAEVRERRRRVGRRAFTPTRLHTYERPQRRRCQTHRWSWRFRADPAARYRVHVRLRVRAAGAQ
jgi:hypothetical protein